MVFLLQAAYHYLDLGLSVIAVDADKQPVWRWRRFQSRRPNRWELRRMFSHPAATGLAIICGSVSGGIEVIDFDLKYDLSGKLFENYCQCVQQKAPELFTQLVFARSRSGGYHILYRTAKPSGYAQLASRPASADEKNEDPSRTSRVLVEVISEKAYIVASPTPGYLLVQGDLADVPLISEEQRTFLWDVARSFDQLPEVSRAASPVLSPARGTGSPFDDYNERGDIVELLQSHGWTVVGQDAMKTYLLRPGDPHSKTSGDFHHRLRLFTLFTPNSPPFERLVGYRPATVFAMLECGGDFKLAARRLLDLGFGVPYNQQKENPVYLPSQTARDDPARLSTFILPKNCTMESFENGQEKKMEGPGWSLDYVINASDAPNRINIHSHGLEESFYHPDLQLCLPARPDYVVAVFRDIVNLIRGGRRFEADKDYNDIFPGFTVRFIAAMEENRQVLRIILPDENNRYDHPIYADQFKQTNMPPINQAKKTRGPRRKPRGH